MSGGRPAVLPETVDRIRSLLAEGRSLRDVSRECGVSAMTVARYRDAAPEAVVNTPAQKVASVKERLRARANPPPEPPPLTGDLNLTPEGILGELQGALLEIREVARAAKASGNHSASQRALRDLGQLLNTVARVSKQLESNRDSIRVPREEVERLTEKMRERAAAICARPMLCAKCSRELSIELAGARDKVDAAENGRRSRKEARANGGQ